MAAGAARSRADHVAAAATLEAAAAGSRRAYRKLRRRIPSSVSVAAAAAAEDALARSAEGAEDSDARATEAGRCRHVLAVPLVGEKAEAEQGLAHTGSAGHRPASAAAAVGIGGRCFAAAKAGGSRHRPAPCDLD